MKSDQRPTLVHVACFYADLTAFTGLPLIPALTSGRAPRDPTSTRLVFRDRSHPAVHVLELKVTELSVRLWTIDSRDS